MPLSVMGSNTSASSTLGMCRGKATPLLTAGRCTTLWSIAGGDENLAIYIKKIQQLP